MHVLMHAQMRSISNLDHQSIFETVLLKTEKFRASSGLYYIASSGILQSTWIKKVFSKTELLVFSLMFVQLT